MTDLTDQQIPRQRNGLNPFLPDAPVRATFTDEGVMHRVLSWRDAEREKEAWRDGDTNTYRYRANLLEAAVVRWQATEARAQKAEADAAHLRLSLRAESDELTRAAADRDEWRNTAYAAKAHYEQSDDRLVSEAGRADALAARLASAEAKLAELTETIEYGHQTDQMGWLPEPRGIKYARHARKVHWRADKPVLIDHWSDPSGERIPQWAADTTLRTVDRARSTAPEPTESPSFDQLLASPSEQFDTKSELREAVLRSLGPRREWVRADGTVEQVPPATAEVPPGSVIPEQEAGKP